MSRKIYKHNPIVRGHFTDSSNLYIPEDEQKSVALGEFEIDLFNAIYYHAQQSLWNSDPDLLDHETVILRYSDMRKFMGIRSNDFKTMVIDSLTQLKTTDIVFKNYTYMSGKTVKNLHISLVVNFAEEVNFDPDVFQIDLNPIISRAMAMHENNFTLIDLSKTRRLSSKYAKRIYEWLLSMKQINKEIRIDIDGINKLMGMEETDFKQANRILKRIYPQVSEMIPYEYEYRRSSKVIIFRITKKGEELPVNGTNTLP